MIRIILADDHQMFLDGLNVFLQSEEDIEIIGLAKDGEEAIDLIEQHDVDIAVLDIEMPKLNGVEATRLIKKDYSNTKVLVLTMYNDKTFINNLMQTGIDGYILKNKSKEELLGAIRNVAKGQPHFGLEVLTVATSTTPTSTKKIKLTEREKDVLCLIAEGHATKKIASELFISEPTVNTHKRNLLRKLDVPNDKHLVRYAIKEGYIEL